MNYKLEIKKLALRNLKNTHFKFIKKLCLI